MVSYVENMYVYYIATQLHSKIYCIRLYYSAAILGSQAYYICNSVLQMSISAQIAYTSFYHYLLCLHCYSKILQHLYNIFS